MSESDSYPKAEFFRKPYLSNNSPNVPKCGLNTRHDNREVTLIHLTQAQTLRCDKCATGSIHAKGSMTINVIPFCVSDDDKCYRENMSQPENYKNFEFDSGNEE